MCDEFASVCHWACSAFWAPRYWPGSHPCDLRSLWPKVSVLRDHLVLLGSFPSFRLLFSFVSFAQLHRFQTYSLFGSGETHGWLRNAQQSQALDL